MHILGVERKTQGSSLFLQSQTPDKEEFKEGEEMGRLGTKRQPLLGQHRDQLLQAVQLGQGTVPSPSRTFFLGMFYLGRFKGSTEHHEARKEPFPSLLELSCYHLSSEHVGDRGECSEASGEVRDSCSLCPKLIAELHPRVGL
jgi:hypothetical protein